MGLVSELRRRNVFRMLVLYVVAAWLIMQVAEVLIDLAKLPDWIGLAVLGLLAIGFPIALIFSWFYELTPEGVSLEKDVAPGESITHVTGRRMDFIVISLLSAAVILFAWHTWWPSAPMDNSIAVMAFENMSGDPEQEYFSDGVSEELLNALAHVPELRVISRSSAFSFKGKDVAAPEIARQLNVANVLEGSVRKMGNRVRITAQLIEANTDSHLWSATYDRELDDIFVVQDEISAAIVAALQEHLGPQVEVAPRVISAANTEAHDAYLRGRYLLAQRTVEGAAREFEKAISFDPDYAPAHAELAMATLLLTNLNYGDLTFAEAIARAIPHVERAMALDPTLAEAHAANGFLFHMQGLEKEALQHFERAIQINPNYSVVYTWMAFNYGWLGRYEESFSAKEMAMQVDPLSILAINNYAADLISRNRLDEADRELEKLDTLAPAWAASMRGVMASRGGKWANLVLGQLEELRIDPPKDMHHNELAAYFALVGLEKEALAISKPVNSNMLILFDKLEDAVTTAEALFAENQTNSFRQRLGLTLAAAGDYGRARPILEESWQRRGGLVTHYINFNVYAAAALIAIRQYAGEGAKVAEVIAAIRDHARRYREAGITRAGWNRSADYEAGLADYLSGEREKGLALIAKGTEDGYFIPTHLAYLQALYDDPGFAPILSSQESRQARERNKVLDIVCTDNPYASFWQPAEGTCEEFAVAGRN